MLRGCSLLPLLLCLSLGLCDGRLLLMHAWPRSLLRWHAVDRGFLPPNSIRVDVVSVGVIEWRAEVKVHVYSRTLCRWCIEIEGVINCVGAKVTIRDSEHALSLTVDDMVILADGKGIGQCTNRQTGLLLVKFILMAWACEGLLTWLREEQVVGVLICLVRERYGFGLG